MKSSGLLRIVHEPNQGVLTWTWTASDSHADRSYSKRLTLEECHKAIGEFYERWESVNQEIRLNHIMTARERLEEARKCLTARLVPDDMDLARIAASGTLIRVVVDPDTLPLECLDAGGMPLAVRYWLLHTKKNQSVSAPMDGSAGNRPRAYSAIMSIGQIMHANHAKVINDVLQILYGKDGAGQAMDLNVTAESTVHQLCADDLACFYYFGHGSPKESGGLCLYDACLDSVYLRNRLTPVANRAGRLAFLNCCWSAACPLPEMIDPARAFLEGGWSTVVGTVLPPLDLVAAPFGENLFKLLLDCRCNVHRALVKVQSEKWEQYHTNPTKESFAWASYRLYGVDGEQYLWTPATQASGDIVYCDFRIGPVDRFDLSPEQLGLLCEIFGRETAEAVFEALVTEERLESVAKQALSVFARQGVFPFRDKFKQIVKEVLVRADQNSSQVCLESSILKNLDFEQLSEAIEDVVNELCLLRTGDVAPWKPIILSDSALSCLIDFSRGVVEERDLRTVCLQIQGEKKLEIKRKNLLAAIREKPYLAALVRAMWVFCEQEPHLVDLFCAALVQGLAEGVQRICLDEEMQWKLDESKPLIFEADVCMALMAADWQYGIAPDRPYWWHVLITLAMINHGNMAGLAREGLCVRNLMVHAERLLGANGVRLAMPVAADRGNAVGQWWLRLPKSVVERWHNSFEQAVEILCDPRRGQIALAVPWEPSFDANLDAVAIEFRERLKMRPNWRKRYWVHLGTEELVVFPIGRSLFRRWQTDDHVAQILREGKNRGVLVVSGGRQDRVDNWSQWKSEAGKVLNRMALNNIKALLFFSISELKIIKQFLDEKHVDIVIFDPLELQEIRDFVIAWEKQRGRQPIDAALNLLVDIIKQKSKEHQLTAAIEIWNEACRQAKGTTPSPSDIREAVR